MKSYQYKLSWTLRTSLNLIDNLFLHDEKTIWDHGSTSFVILYNGQLIDKYLFLLGNIRWDILLIIIKIVIRKKSYYDNFYRFFFFNKVIIEIKIKIAMKMCSDIKLIVYWSIVAECKFNKY